MGFSIADWGLGLLIWIGDWDWEFGGGGEMINFKHLKNVKALFETFLNKTRYSLVIFAMALVVC